MKKSKIFHNRMCEVSSCRLESVGTSSDYSSKWTTLPGVAVLHTVFPW